MKEKKYSLKTKMIFFTVLVIITSIIFTSAFFSRWAFNNLKETVKINNMNLAINIGNYSYFGDVIEEGKDEEIIQNHTQDILKNMKNVDFIVIADMDGIRLTHPNSERLGKKIVGGDEDRVIEKGDTYITEETGTLGKSIRAFAPIKDSNNNQVGFVLVGTLIKEFNFLKNEALKSIIIYSIGGLILGIIGSLIVAQNIKKSLLGLEPFEISRMYREKNSMLEALQEGIISIDSDMKIVTINDSALQILKINDKNVLGEEITNIIPNTNMIEVFKTGESIIGGEGKLNGVNIVRNIVPIKESDKITGVVATFRDKTEITKMAEEITGYNEIVNALRANSHEFSNKLHIILGLIQIGEVEEAKEFILGIKNREEKMINYTLKNIKDPIIVALLFGKVSRAKELGVNFNINKKSSLEKLNDKSLSHSLVTIMGNLIENAFESTINIVNKKKNVDLYIENSPKYIKIIVEDNGIGIKEKYFKKIFKENYSTKGENRGFGLSLVKNKLKTLSGTISIDSKLKVGTSIKIVIPKEDMDE